MNYTLNQLQIFLKVAETGSVTKAAEELHLTQPAVSIQLKNFQDQFDIALTEVVGRKIYVTDFGKEIAIAAENIMQQIHAIQFKTLAYKNQLIGKLKLSVVSTGKYIMPYFLSGFMNQNQGVQLAMDVTNKQTVIESLEKNEIDFALVSIIPNDMQVERLDLLLNKLYLVSTNNYGLNQTQTIASIKDYPFIFREKGSATRQAMEAFFEKEKITVFKKMELTSNEAVKQAVLANLGCSIMPLIGIKTEIQNRLLSIIPIENMPIVTTWSLIWLKGKKHTPTALAFLDYVQKEKQKIVDDVFNWYENY